MVGKTLFIRLADGVCMLVILLTFIQCTSKNKNQSEEAEKELMATEKLMSEWAEEINKSCPVRVDDITRLDSVRVYPDKLFQYYYTITDRSKFDVDQWKTIGEKQIRNMYKRDPSMAEFRIHGVSAKYQYADKDGITFYSFTVTPDDYKSGAEK